MKQSKEIRKNRIGTEDFDIYIAVIFGCFYHQSFISERGPGL